MRLLLCSKGVEFSRRLEASIEQNFTSQIIPYACKKGLVEKKMTQLSASKFLTLDLLNYRFVFDLFICNIRSKSSNVGMLFNLPWFEEFDIRSRPKARYMCFVFELNA